MENRRKILPLVASMVAQSDELFVALVGPIGYELAEVAFKKWSAEGKTGPSGLRRYVVALSEQLDDVEQRKTFLVRAERLLLQLQSGLSS
jgi:hypothetical protein